MNTLSTISKWIKEIYKSLNKLAEELTADELKEFPALIMLIEEFSESNRQWRYYTKLKSDNLINSLVLAINQYEKDPDKRFLKKIDEISREILSEIRALKNSSSLWQSEVLEWETRLQLEIELTPIYFELQQNLVNLKSEFENLSSKQEEIQLINTQTINSQIEANRIIDELKNKNEAYSQLIDENSNTRIRKLYDDIYEEEILIANKYRDWALRIFLSVGVLISLSIIFILFQNSFAFFWPTKYSSIELGWGSLIKTFMLFSLTTPAWYLTKESSKHRKVAYKSKMLGTELASFPLYAREFKDEDRLDLRKILADRFFGQELFNESSNGKNTNDSSLEQMRLLTEMNKVLTESLKVKKSLE